MRSARPLLRLSALALGAALTLAPGAAPQSSSTPPPAGLSADEVYFRFRDAYVGLAGYHDTGEIERIDGAGSARIRFRTDLERDGELRFSFLTQGGEPASLSARRRGAAAPARPFAGALDEALGAGAAEALPVPVLVADGALSPAEPAALTLDGVEACGESRCHVVAGARPEAGISFRLWVGESDFLLRRSEVELTRGTERRTFRVVLQPVVESRAEPRVEVAAEAGVFSETIDVTLSSITLRVIDLAGRAVPDLAAGDFRLRLGGEELSIEAVEWVGESAPTPDELAAAAEAEEATPEGGVAGFEVDEPAGRLVLFFVQASLESSRASGHMKFLRHAHSFVDGLSLADRAAVVSFDSHLKVRADFSSDRAATREALDAAWKPGPEPRPDRRRRDELSLARHLDRTAAARAASPERALEVVARALEPLPGEKLVVYLGFGFGHYSSTGVTMTAEYDDAVRALAAADATVFALDVTDAATHSLEIGMKEVARDTGGTYLKTNEFPALASRELRQTLAGHYVVYFRLPEGGRKRAQELRVDLRDGSRGEVLVRKTTIR